MRVHFCRVDVLCCGRYLKVDVDAILRPHNLLRFLGAIPPDLALATPLYFGNLLGATSCGKTMLGNANCATKGFGRSMTNQTTLDSHGASHLRDSVGWRKLEASMSATLGLASRRHHQVWTVRYGMGGSYGFSALAAQALVRTACVQRVGALPCHAGGRGGLPGRGCAHNVHGKGLNTHEDAAAGLCAHLAGARLIQCSCFSNNRLVGGSRPTMSPPSWALSGVLENKLKQRAAGSGSAPSDNAASLAMLVAHYFKDDEEPPQATYSHLCARPITVHPIKDHRRQYVAMWEALNLRATLYESDADAS